MEIAGRTIGDGQPPFIIAELSANHNGDLQRALAIVDAAHAAGADAVKLQTYTADTLTLDCDRPEFKIHGGLWNGRTLHDLYREAAMPWDWHEPLFARCRELGLIAFSSPFDETAVEYLAGLDAPAYKIASFEAVHLPLIKAAAATGKPLIISTGMAGQEEISQALATARAAGCDKLMILHCISAYPAPAAQANLQTIGDMKTRFGVEVGLSDHTRGTAVAVAAVALGASAIEKHVTLNRSDGGPDSAFSLEPDELKTLVADCTTAAEALGTVCYQRGASELGNVNFRRSIFVVDDIQAGAALSPENVRIIRPGHGLAPKFYDDVVGRTATKALKRGTPLTWDAIAS